jgi:flagellar basal-body rod protein FlgF
MPGGQYVALSGMRLRLDELDRLSIDLANAGTAGYKAERTGDAAAERPTFNDALQSAIDVTAGGRRLDTTNGSIEPTGRDLDVAIEGEGYFTVQTPGGDRYTRNGHFTRNADGFLATASGSTVLGDDGEPIKLGAGKVSFEEDGRVVSGDTVAGRLAVVRFADPGKLQHEAGATLRAPDDMAPEPEDKILINQGTLEQSNVAVVQRISEITDVSRVFEALQKSVSVMMNDVYGQAIQQLGRR